MESEYGSLLDLAEPDTKHLDHSSSVQFLPPMEHRLAPGTLVRVVQLPACAWRECTVTSVQSCDDGVEATAQVLPTHGTAELEPEVTSTFLYLYFVQPLNGRLLARPMHVFVLLFPSLLLTLGS